MLFVVLVVRTYIYPYISVYCAKWLLEILLLAFLLNLYSFLFILHIYTLQFYCEHILDCSFKFLRAIRTDTGSILGLLA